MMANGSSGGMFRSPVFWLLFGLVDFLVILALLWFFWLQPQWDGIMGTQTQEDAVAGAEAVFTLPEKAPYRITKTFDLLDYHVVRLDHTIHRQGYVVVTGVKKELYDTLMARGLEPQLVEQTANNLLKVKDPKNPDQLDVEELRITGSGIVSSGNASVDYRKVSVRFHTLKKPESQSVELISGVLNRISSTPPDDITVIVSYGKSGEFQPEAYQTFVEEAAFVSPVAETR